MFATFERPTPQAGKTLPQLDALRGVAILAVFVQHLGDRFLPLVRSAIETFAPASLVPWILTTLHHAWWGVDLFFVLSGFSLSLSWFRSKGHPAGLFLIRRAARILPGYYVALIVTLVFHRFILALPHFIESILTHLLVLQGYYTRPGIVIIGASWSLTTEVSFYLVFPWLARLVSSPKLERLLLACALVALSWFVRGALHDWALEPGVVTGLLEATQRRWLPSRLDQFLLGALAARAFVVLEHSARATRCAPYVLLTSLPTLIIAFKVEGAYYLEPGGSYPYALLSLVTTAMVLSACLCRGRTLAIITPRPLVFTGIVSYGVFLYHQLALGLCDFEPGLPPTWTNLGRTTILGLGLSLVVGYVSWMFVEKPAMKWATAATSPPGQPFRSSTRPSE